MPRRRFGTGFRPDGNDVVLPLQLDITITGTGAATASAYLNSSPWNLNDPRDRTLDGESHTAAGGVIHISPLNSALWGQTVEVVVHGGTYTKWAYEAAVTLARGATTINLDLDKMSPFCSAGADLERPTGGYLVNIADLCASPPPDGSKVNVYEGSTLLGSATVAGGVITGTIDTTEIADGVHFVDVWWFNDAHADYCSTFMNLTTAGG